MTKNFDQICKGILGEMITPQNQQQQQKPAQPQQPAPGAGAPTAIQNNVQNNGTQNTAQQPANDLMKAFETLTKHAANNQDHVKAIAALQQLLTAQQQNAANQPVQKA